MNVYVVYKKDFDDMSASWLQNKSGITFTIYGIFNTYKQARLAVENYFKEYFYTDDMGDFYRAVDSWFEEESLLEIEAFEMNHFEPEILLAYIPPR